MIKEWFAGREQENFRLMSDVPFFVAPVSRNWRACDPSSLRMRKIFSPSPGFCFNAPVYESDAPFDHHGLRFARISGDEIVRRGARHHRALALDHRHLRR